ncbi:Crp/Fnr family transcriptional regulator [Moraxella sp. FZLJ2107]|uniref:Crp/Fnr family transcriptional regulator n=1 Tax=unclassified Moraxella TaxID=2685852 RepID=UPI00209C514B|nr:MULTISPECIES: Crp/Fnr family transcriptional regulator [unclassified Moraxella]USZ15672.1 Crp/Fnr family transcriptional regulator [Moraxella sp. FZFQ2102]UTO04535.1 Crp/Fnr family transcriptional regulator [Moraxella sp. FZLJ2107]UTO23368.1 Crp/Fnr family transcriptional regulator [Moraxella sp. FZLJ2109]
MPILYEKPMLEIDPKVIWRLNDSEIFTLHRQYLQSVLPMLSTDDVAWISASFSIERLPAKHYWASAGQSIDKLGFILSGLCKLSYQMPDGSEINVQFIAEQDAVGDFMAVFKDLPTKYNMQTIEPSILMILDKAHFEACCDKYPDFLRYVHGQTMALLFRHIERTESFLIADNTARYLSFIKDNPKLVERLSLADLSSYLGMTRQSITRIRKNLGLTQKSTDR